MPTRDSPTEDAPVPAGDRPRGLTADEFRDIIGHFASGVTVITARHDGLPYGTTASAVTSLSLEPPMLLVCMNKDSATGQAIHATGRFAVNILDEDHPDLAVSFARKGLDKFTGVAVSEGAGGVPLLDSALARLECTTRETVSGGTHWVFLAEVDWASARSGAPLAYFRGRFGRLQLAEDERCVGEIRSRIMNRLIPIGRPLDLDDLGAELDIPRGTVYHALAKLNGEGLVQRDRSGAFVVPALTLREADDAVRGRWGIILGAAALTVEDAGPEEIAGLRELLAASHRLRDGEVDQWIATHHALVERLVRLAHSETLFDAFQRLNVPGMVLSFREALPRLDVAFDRDAFYCGSCDLVEAYERGDYVAVVRAIRRLLMLSRESMRAIFEDQASY